jgi:hypothetical protein
MSRRSATLTIGHHHHHHEHDHNLGAVPVLDIGGEVGALVVYLPAMTPSGELDIAPDGDLDARFHTGVHDRLLGSATVPVAVFPEVVAGTYTLLDDALVPFATVAVTGGEVAELDLRAVR